MESPQRPVISAPHIDVSNTPILEMQAFEGHGIRLYGSAVVNNVLYYYVPESDYLVESTFYQNQYQRLRDEFEQMMQDR